MIKVCSAIDFPDSVAAVLLTSLPLTKDVRVLEANTMEGKALTSKSVWIKLKNVLLQVFSWLNHWAV